MPDLINLTADNLNFLASIVGEQNISAKSADLDQHSKDESFHSPVPAENPVRPRFDSN